MLTSSTLKKMSSSIFCKIVKSDKDEEVHFQLGY